MSAGLGKYTKIRHIVRLRQILRRRFVVRVFRKLLIQAEEEYGFSNQGLLAIPCDESVVEQVIQLISGNHNVLTWSNAWRSKWKHENGEDFETREFMKKEVVMD
ncbi:hypothetical protein Gogos_011689 [Gossypium gossypioides]|uniref:Uncharacterized protein n=1 Tax=Gossypium gossypioides TaxID=34282 RepID=A0A7J9BQ62_GOSGO|nr:hypothetical protein [Gossypium gossypioides]